MKTLHLTLKKEWFDIMVTGEKKIEIRSPSDWITSRLNKTFDVVKFVNGYGNKRPYFVCELGGFYIQPETEEFTYSDGKSVTAFKYDIIIMLGQIIERGNL